jgi:hypothetical protein
MKFLVVSRPLRYFRADIGNATITLSWSSLTRNKTLIESKYLYHTDALGSTPYAVTISPAPIVAGTSTIVTSPLPKLIAGIPATIAFQARDAFGNNMWNSSDAAVTALFTATLTSTPVYPTTLSPTPLHPTINISVAPMEAGMYNITFVPRTQGMQILNIMYRNVSLGGHPMNISVSAGMTNASATTLVTNPTHAVTSSSTAPPFVSSVSNATAGTVNWFVIEARDVFGNGRGVGGDVLTVLLTGVSDSRGHPSSVNCSGVVSDKLDGTYNVSYRCPVSGVYQFHVFLNETLPVANTPFKFTVVPALAFANRTIVSIPVTNVFPTTAVANQSSTIAISTKDAFSNWHSGHDGVNNVVMKCTDNYGSWVRGIVTDLATGTYNISFNLTRASAQWQCFVLVVDGGPLASNVPNGLTARYFNNRWMAEAPVLQRVESDLNFQWGTDLVTPDAANYVSAQFSGYIKPEFADTYTFYVHADDSARLFVDGVLVVDTWKAVAPGEKSGTWTVPAGLGGQLFDILVHYKQTTGTAFLVVQWECVARGVAKQVVPRAALFSGASNMPGSPFVVQT